MIHTSIRIEDKLHDDLRDTAHKKRVSINTEIVLRLMGYAAMVKQISVMTKQLEAHDDKSSV